MDLDALDDDLFSFLSGTNAHDEAGDVPSANEDAIVVAPTSEDDEHAFNSDEDLKDMMDIIAMQCPEEQAPRKHPRRSWQLMERARNAKDNLKLQRDLVAMRASRDNAEAQLQVVSIVFPGIKRALALPGVGAKSGMDAIQAKHFAVLAASPGIKGQHQQSFQKVQSRAASYVARAIEKVQVQFAHGVLRCNTASDDHLPIEDGLGVPPPSDSGNIVCISWQWDETTQKCKSLLGTRVAGERVSSAQGQTAIKVMMQNGTIHTYNHNRHGNGDIAIPCEPYVCRAMFLERANSEYLLEAVLRLYPVPIEDDEALSKIDASGQVVLLTFSHDRASANYPVLQWLFGRVLSPTAFPNILTHAEPCALHGFQLVRMRPIVGKQILGGCFSFTRFLRCWRSADAWRRELIKFVRGFLVVVHSERSDEAHRRNEQVRQILYGDVGCHRPDKKGKVQSLVDDFDEILNLISLESGSLTHNCFVTEGCPANKNGKRVGATCCKNRDEAVEKVAAAVLNFLTGRAWVVASENRWTHTATTLKRIVVGYLLGGLLGKSLNNLQSFWGLDDNVEAELAQVLREDAGNFDAQRKVRLLRIARTLAHEDAPWQAAVVLTSLQPVEKLMYVAFGNKGKDVSSTFLDFVGWNSPGLATAQSSLWDLLSEFHADNTAWALLALGRGDFSAVAQRKFTRQQVLQLSAGLLDHFEMRWGEPPYSLIPLIERDTPEPVRKRIAREFLDKPLHCLSPFLLKLRRRCPNVQCLLRDGTHIIRAWNANTKLGIDFVERSLDG